MKDVTDGIAIGGGSSQLKGLMGELSEAGFPSHAVRWVVPPLHHRLAAFRHYLQKATVCRSQSLRGVDPADLALISMPRGGRWCICGVASALTWGSTGVSVGLSADCLRGDWVDKMGGGDR